jgi:hypothetical protein
VELGLIYTPPIKIFREPIVVCTTTCSTLEIGTLIILDVKSFLMAMRTPPPLRQLLVKLFLSHL